MRSPVPELNPQYTFDNFVVGPCNLFAQSAARGIAEKPAELYNPFFLYGGVGLGKTHLMQAIGHHALSARGGRLKTTYLSTENFTNQLISAIQNRSTEAFRQRFRNTDILLIDDIHFIAGKDATQEEFFHTFNALHDRKKQIVISSDRPPKEIPTLEDRLVSRFQWGLVAALEPPDLVTRIAILRQKARTCKMPIPTEVLETIARHVNSNIRELEGTLTRLVASASVRGVVPTMQLAEEMLHHARRRGSEHDLTPEAIRRATARFFGIRESDLTSSRRSRSVTFPRQVGMCLSRELTSASLVEIGRAFGRKDHTTVIHACRKINELRQNDPKQASLIERMREELANDRAAGDS